MIMELPKKFNLPFVEVVDDMLLIYQLVRFEDLMYELTYAQKKKKCVYCAQKLKKKSRTLAHRYPRATGGISITNNLFPCCSACNSDKGNLTHREYLIYRDMRKKEQKEYVKEVTKQKGKILERIGYVLPSKWVEIVKLDDVKYREVAYELRGKKYYRNLEFYNKYNKLPRPIIVDREYQLLDGYNIILLAKDFNIQYIPTIRLENIIVTNSKD